ncbi:TolC family protein [Cyanobium sp. T1G-Tous]|uniref:TolC family protein n=1 Tax=Cyanobium sp. T1G-Tous TaxID=2823722 RepID=UPI0028F432BB|nr:TolC family protein [Cyanobium sp. T1G-Tous]
MRDSRTRFLSICYQMGGVGVVSVLMTQVVFAAPQQDQFSPLPTTKTVESLGSGWPVGQTKPIGMMGSIPAEQLAALEMATAVELADQRNPVVRQSYEELVATQNSLGSAYATWWPVVNASITGGMYGERAYYNYVGALTGVGAPPTNPPSPYADQTSFSSSYFQSVAQFDINWNIFDPARTPTIWQNKYLVRQAVDAFVISRRDNRLKTEEAFINLQQASSRIVTGRVLVANDQVLLRLAQSRVRLGVASKLDLAKQTTVLKTDQVNLVDAKRAVQEAQADLAELLDTLDASVINPAVPLAPLGSWTSGLEETIQAAMSYRKVIEQQLSEVKINQAQAKIELAVYQPTIALVNSLYWTKGVGYTGLGPPYVQDARSDFWNATSLLQVTFTGFDGGQARMSAAAAMRRGKAAEAQVQQAVNQVRREVQTYFAQSQQGRQAVLLSAERVTSASDALRLQTLRFNAGYGNVTDVVQAQQDLTQSVSDYIDQLASYNVALLSLARASGLSYQQDDQLIREVGNPLDRLRLPNLLAGRS